MSGGTVRTRPRAWDFRCDHCDHTYRALADSRTAARCTARLNGWVTDSTTLCPGCAVVAAVEQQLLLPGKATG
ncbi:hypothetical protein CBI38_18685 [Rhodococcus oxybenzonivorans]|uniref:Uncharacterized protein n=1 Tax=Rhodococcus oxybenzonivorans TaxID=1990687 RepID=A0A2S2BXA5_9NOCA|nr:hypothetical protein [Rhodococcus oxybenzonivorans]AWK73286.1 hypothetical protein CBI38_18685 [Rhodococcus oxybenzonivorans]